ncbi:MAG: hypothetical protein IAE93_14435 [Ignavibacteria bacterium]|nr:hypothetical protein [Ignavibacteria bacterium]
MKTPTAAGKTVNILLSPYQGELEGVIKIISFLKLVRRGGLGKREVLQKNLPGFRDLAGLKR